MSEYNGTKALLYRLDGVTTFELVGQLEVTSAFNNAAIDISNKADGDWVKLMNGETSTKGLTLSATCIYNNSDEYILMRENALSGIINSYRLDYTGTSLGRIDFFGMPNGLSDAVPRGDKITTSLSIVSTGEF
jgi:hypothetical protein